MAEKLMFAWQLFIVLHVIFDLYIAHDCVYIVSEGGINSYKKKQLNITIKMLRKLTTCQTLQKQYKQNIIRLGREKPRAKNMQRKKGYKDFTNQRKS